MPRILHVCLDFLISQDQKKYRLANWVFLAVFFVGGVYLLGHFLAWGSASIEFGDWGEIAAPRLTLMKEAIIHLQLPLESFNPMVIGGSDTYQILAIPDLLLSPQLLLLPFVSIGQFYVFQVLLMYVIGFLGLVKLKSVLKLSALTFSILFLLFNFNGNILAHLSVGHLTWGGYFLFAWLVVLIFEMLETRPGWWWTLKVAFLLFFMLLQGSYHQYVWCLFLLGLLGLSFPRYFWVLLKTAVLTLLLSLFRLLPEVTLLGGVTNNFLTGFPDFQSIWNYLVNIQRPGALSPLAAIGNPIGLWEATTYIGLIGALFLVYFGFFRPLVNPDSDLKYRRLLLPVAGLVFMTLTPVYDDLRNFTSLAIFTGERVITRMISLAFVLLLILAANEFQKWLSSARSALIPVTASLVLLAFSVVDLYQNYYTWSVARAIKSFPPVVFTPSQWFIANQFTNAHYLSYVIWGAAGTAATFIFLLVMVRREKRSAKIAAPNVQTA